VEIKQHIERIRKIILPVCEKNFLHCNVAAENALITSIEYRDKTTHTITFDKESKKHYFYTK